MFGMLDYRAHKLLWLLMLPLALIGMSLRFVIIGAAILIAQKTGYHPLVKIVVAYVAFEVICLIVLNLFNIIPWMVRSVFFWVIDVVPAHGADAEEARAVVLQGRAFELGRKLMKNIGQWTAEDTDGFITVMNWRARLFFGNVIRERMQCTVAALKRICDETGQQPCELDIVKIRKETCGNVPWFETAIVNQYVFNSVMALVIIVLVVGHL